MKWPRRQRVGPSLRKENETEDNTDQQKCVYLHDFENSFMANLGCWIRIWAKISSICTFHNNGLCNSCSFTHYETADSDSILHTRSSYSEKQLLPEKAESLRKVVIFPLMFDCNNISFFNRAICYCVTGAAIHRLVKTFRDSSLR